MANALSKEELEGLLPYCQSEEQEAYLKAYIEHGSGAKAAKAIGKSERNLREAVRRVRSYAEKGGFEKPEAKYNLELKDELEAEVIAPMPNMDFIESTAVYKIITSKTQPEKANHLFIPDTQCKPDVSSDYMEWAGKYVVDRLPDVIIHIGDGFDMPSLSAYDRGKKKAEGKRVALDIKAGIDAFNRFLKPIYDYQQEQLRDTGKISYKPRMIYTCGNHEERIMRHVNANPELDGFLSYENLRLKDMGWEFYDFLEPVVVNGVAYCHYMANPMSGKPYGGQAMNILKNVGESFSCGHAQKLDVATRFLPASGQQQWGLIAGAYYEHNEDYKGHQGNKHWRGLVVKHGVENGSYNPMFVDLDYLKERFG